MKKNSKYLDVKIDWSDVRFHDTTKWPRVGEDPFDDSEKAQGDVNENAGEALKAELCIPHSSVLFQTKFVNNTESDQEYTMKTEKTTTSTCSTEVETCFTKGMEMGITLKSPGEILEVNAGYKRELSLTNTQGQTFEEELHWGVESQIRVKAKHVAEAQLIVNEKKQSGDFEIESQIWGMVYVNFNNIRDNNSLVKATGNDICDIVKEYIEKEQRKNGVSFPFISIDETKSRVHVITKGKCQFRFGIKQEVKVDQKKINP